MSSTEVKPGKLRGDAAGEVLLRVARSAIAEALGCSGRAGEHPEWLNEPAATFVTLRVGDELRGCIGSLEVRRSLFDDVRENACAAALRDSRFPPLTAAELESVTLEVSVLSALEPLGHRSEADILRTLRPGVDGVLIEHAGRRGTFLPQVWESVPQPRRFLSELKRKAGLPADFWSKDMRVWRYTVAKWSEQESPAGVAGQGRSSLAD